VNVGQVYNTLDRLERDKLVRRTGENNYYEITPAGRAQVAAWFGSPSPWAELAPKLALAASLPGVDVGSIIRIQRAAAASATVAEPAPESAAQLSYAILATAAAVARRSELSLLDEIELLTSRGIVPTSLSSDIPKRGRPTKAAG
jgi:DNA-binding PadR family transcriptional regulator